jgi:POT family proton-dependent oligopeptide transporter
MNEAAADALPTPAASATLLGQPRGLWTLFLTEMWERFTFYGMRAVLILFLVAGAARGGLGLDDKTANSIYGLYLGGTYLLGLPGGWVADRLLGGQRAVFAGGVLIAAGNLILAVASLAHLAPLFFVGLVVIVLGVGLLKPNVSALVASLYPEGGARRDAGFSFFYMGINSGAFLGSFFVPLLAAWLGWHWGFGIPAAGMAIGLIQLRQTRRYLGGAGHVPAERSSWWPVLLFVGAIALIAVLAMTGALHLNAVTLGASASWVMLALGVGYFVYLLFFAGLTRSERNRVLVMVALFAGSVMFWAGYEQQGASFNLFAERYTERHILGWEMPAGVLQAVNPLFVITLSPVFAFLWLALGRRNLDFAATVKFGAGLICLGLGFLVMLFAANHVLAGEHVLPVWLLCTYFLHTLGELSLSPVGLSYMSKLTPPRFVGQVMGVWFLSLALGSNLAGQLSGSIDTQHMESLPGLYSQIFWSCVVAGAVMLLLTPLVKRLMAGVK